MPASTPVKDIVLIALFAAFTAALGLFPSIYVGLPAPITAQSMGPMLAGAVLGARRGALAMLLLWLLVAVGLPLLAGGRGGFGVVIGPTGGFFAGWIAAAFIVGRLVRGAGKPFNLWRAALAIGFGGIVVIYVPGIIWLAFIAHIAPMKAALSVLAFIPGDLIKVALTCLLAREAARLFPELTDRR